MIKNIIFDLGGVIYELDFDRFNRNLTLLQQQPNPQEIYSRLKQPSFFSDYERGNIDTVTFRNRMRAELNIVASDDQIDRAWNSLLVGLFPDRLELITRLKSSFNLALLSNINPLHLEHINLECRDLFNQFDRCFFSCELGTRKPEAQIFELVLNRMGFVPEETLFVDDSPPNIDGATNLGIKAILLDQPENLSRIIDILPTLNRSGRGSGSPEIALGYSCPTPLI